MGNWVYRLSNMQYQYTEGFSSPIMMMSSPVAEGFITQPNPHLILIYSWCGGSARMIRGLLFLTVCLAPLWALQGEHIVSSASLNISSISVVVGISLTHLRISLLSFSSRCCDGVFRCLGWSRSGSDWHCSCPFPASA